MYIITSNVTSLAVCQADYYKVSEGVKLLLTERDCLGYFFASEVKMSVDTCLKRNLFREATRSPWRHRTMYFIYNSIVKSEKIFQDEIFYIT